MEDLVSDLYAAVTETTTSTIRWILFYLIRHPEIQKKVHREIEQEVGKLQWKNIVDKPSSKLWLPRKRLNIALEIACFK